MEDVISTDIIKPKHSKSIKDYNPEPNNNDNDEIQHHHKIKKNNPTAKVTFGGVTRVHLKKLNFDSINKVNKEDKKENKEDQKEKENKEEKKEDKENKKEKEDKKEKKEKKEKREKKEDDTMKNFYNRYEDIFKEVKIDQDMVYEEKPKKKKKKKKRVNLDEIIKEAVILKKLEYDNEFIFQKPRKLKKSDIKKLVAIQKVFKGFQTRNIELKADRLRVRECLLELFCLLVVGNYLRALKRKAFLFFTDNFKDVVMEVNEEISFGDKIQFKLPNCYYNGHKINDLQDIEIKEEGKKEEDKEEEDDE